MTFDRSTTIGFIGFGRLGGSLARALDRAGYSVIASYRRTPPPSASRNDLPRCARAQSAQTVVDVAQIVFVTTPDDALASAIRDVTWRVGQAAVHCSGAADLSVLAAAAESGAVIGSFHPLQTFPTDHSFDRLAGVTFAVESHDDALREWLVELAKGLGGRPLSVPPEARAAYHASAVMACGLMAGLVGLAAEMWTCFGRSREEALEALSPLVTSTAEQIRDLGMPAALTGPLVRGDRDTLVKHLDATGTRSSEIRDAYAALALAELPLANEQGDLTQQRCEELRRLFKNVLGGAQVD